MQCSQGALQGGTEHDPLSSRARADNASDIIAHLVGEMELTEGPRRMQYHTPGERLGTFVVQ